MVSIVNGPYTGTYVSIERTYFDHVFLQIQYERPRRTFAHYYLRDYKRLAAQTWTARSLNTIRGIGGLNSKNHFRRNVVGFVVEGHIWLG